MHRCNLYRQINTNGDIKFRGRSKDGKVGPSKERDSDHTAA
jgi:hypothetical protein